MKILYSLGVCIAILLFGSPCKGSDCTEIAGLWRGDWTGPDCNLFDFSNTWELAIADDCFFWGYNNWQGISVDIDPDTMTLSIPTYIPVFLLGTCGQLSDLNGTFSNTSVSGSFSLGSGENGTFSGIRIADPGAKIMSPSGNVTIGAGGSIEFGGWSFGSSPPFTYLWDFDGGAENSNELSPGWISFPVKGIYLVSFTVTDTHGLSHLDSVLVNVGSNSEDSLPALGESNGGGGGCFIKTLR
jgi:hypothetical protein